MPASNNVTTKSGRGLPHSKTLRAIHAPPKFGFVLLFNSRKIAKKLTEDFEE